LTPKFSTTSSRVLLALQKFALPLARGGRAAPFACRQLVRVAQWLAARRELSVRMATLKNDRRLQSMLAFAGKSR
jgi:hypothetical protein